MGYSDAKYNTREYWKAEKGVTGTLTATASGHVVTNAAASLGMPTFKRRTKINNIDCKITTAPVAGTVTLTFLNGTNTVGQAAISTNTAGVVVAASMTAANQVAAAGDAVTIVIAGTGTASANQVAGVYDVYLETIEQFAGTA